MATSSTIWPPPPEGGPSNNSFTRSVAAWLIRQILSITWWTCRWSVVLGEEHLDALRSGSEPRVVCFWHNRSVLAASFLHRKVVRRGGNLTILASLSKDGDLASRVAEGLGVNVVRGSSSRGGINAMRALVRNLRKTGSSPVVIPDGPRGPTYQFKAGAGVLSQVARAPVLLIGIAASRYSTIGSWDRLRVAWPGSKIAVVICAPQPIRADLTPDEQEEERRRLERLLADATSRAEEASGGAKIEVD